MRRGSITPLFAVMISAVTSAQTFVDDTAAVPSGFPANGGNSENVDFADVDLDGDLDVAIADGGDDGNEQNRLWMNLGGAQGGVIGTFQDQTATRLPAILDTSRDVEFADVDADADPDLFITNTAQITFQSSRIWINRGPGAGQVGFYVDETATRWVGLGEPGSSVGPSLLHPNGRSVHSAHDTDFADLDNDGDLDLVHSANGGSYSGLIPTRIYLNDGNGNFEEFNPSGFQLASLNLQDGDPGLWCEGTHQSDTLDTTGAECDIALTVVDLELGDTDGDLDIDLLLGSRSELPRFFRNRLEETGSLAFRDVTHDVWAPGHATGAGHYDQELGDLDDDGDLDLYGLNWDSFSDVTFTNDGAGNFVDRTVVADTFVDAEEADFVDYDNDGDLDVFVANFSGMNLLLRNDLTGGDFELVDVSSAELPTTGFISKDADAADVDQDGDYDVFVANASSTRTQFFRNVSGVADTTAPRVLRLEPLADGPSSGPRAVRVQVYDNAAYYVTWSNDTFLEYTVDGGPVQTVPMRSSGGQIFRGELPAGLSGTIAYEAVSRDAYGNEGRSGVLSFEACAAPVYCTAKASAQGCLPQIALSGCVSATDPSPAIVGASDVPNQRNGLLFYGFAPAAVPWLGGTLCVQPPLRRTTTQGSGGNLPPANDCSGAYAFDLNDWIQSGADALLVPGTTVYAQYQGRDPQGSFGVVVSNAVELTVGP